MQPELNLKVNLQKPDGTPFEPIAVSAYLTQESLEMIRVIMREELALVKQLLVQELRRGKDVTGSRQKSTLEKS